MKLIQPIQITTALPLTSLSALETLNLGSPGAGPNRNDLGPAGLVPLACVTSLVRLDAADVGLMEIPQGTSVAQVADRRNARVGME